MPTRYQTSAELLGSVSHAVFHHAGCPAAVIARGDQKWMFEVCLESGAEPGAGEEVGVRAVEGMVDQRSRLLSGRDAVVEFRSLARVDHSPVMLSQARRRNADSIRRGVVELRLGWVEDLPDFDRPFDRILAVNTVLFWREPEARLRGLRQLLRQNGLIAVVHQPRGPGACDEGSFAWGRATAEVLGTAGFSDVRMETLRLKPAVTCVLGSNGARS